jgi:hypothetical protein
LLRKLISPLSEQGFFFGLNESIDYLTSPSVAASFLILTFCAAVELGFSREGSTGLIDDCWIAAFRDDQTMSAHAAAKIG